MAVSKSRPASFAVITLIYIFASAIGIITYLMLPFAFWLNLLIADVAATVLVFAFSMIFNNASVYDPYWSVQPLVILAAFSFGKALDPARVLVLIAVFLWGIRLTANWAYTFKGLCFQDWRYTMLCERTGKAYPLIDFVGIHMVPTLVVYGCVLPAVSMFEHEAGWNAGSIVFFVLSVFAFTMQGVADIQMHSFRKKRQRGETGESFIRTGLWKYSRHPNYLGEILMWWGVALSAVSVMPQRWYLAAGAMANTLLFLCVSIPLADGRQAKKEGFDQYRASTRMLLPLRRSA